MHLLIRPKVEWKDKSLKKSLKGKPVVFVCNHTHHFDGVVISSVLSRYKPYMLVKKAGTTRAEQARLSEFAAVFPLTLTPWTQTGMHKVRVRLKTDIQCLSSLRAELQERAKCSRSSPVRHCLRQKKGLDIIPIASLGEYKILFGKRQKILIGNPIKSECPENVRYSKYAKEISAEAEKQVKKALS